MSKRKRRADSTDYPDSSQEGWSDGCGKGKGKRKPMPWHVGRSRGWTPHSKLGTQIRAVVWQWCQDNPHIIVSWLAEMDVEASENQVKSALSPIEYPHFSTLRRLETTLL